MRSVRLPRRSATCTRWITCVALVKRATSTARAAIRVIAVSSGARSSGSAHRYTGTAVTAAPRASRPAISSGFGTPYSWTATRLPAMGSAPSIAARSSRHVLGSATVNVGARPSSRSAATGFGPRATSVTRVSSSAARSRGTIGTMASTSARVPTPVRQTSTSTSPARSARPNASAAGCSASGTSRMLGATNGSPPCFRMSAAISTARRLSNATTRSEVSVTGNLAGPTRLVSAPRATRPRR